MRILCTVGILSSVLAVRSQVQVPLSTPKNGLSDEAAREWSTPPFSDETGQWIFHSVSGHLRHWPSILYRNGMCFSISLVVRVNGALLLFSVGHSIVPGTIAPGTLLYHGRPESSRPPPGPEWVSFDPEHSYLFGRSVYTYIVEEQPLKILYFDGSRYDFAIAGSRESIHMELPVRRT